MPNLNERRRTDADVSRRTVYRHFAAKEDLVFDHPTRWLDHFDSVRQTRGDDEPTRDLCRRGLVSVAEVIQETGDAVAMAFAVYATNPGVRARGAHTEDRWVETYAELLIADVGDDAESQLQVLTVAGSLVAMTNALVAVWAQHRPRFDMADLTREALEHIDPLWPAESR